MMQRAPPARAAACSLSLPPAHTAAHSRAGALLRALLLTQALPLRLATCAAGQSEEGLEKWMASQDMMANVTSDIASTGDFRHILVRAEGTAVALKVQARFRGHRARRQLKVYRAQQRRLLHNQKHASSKSVRHLARKAEKWLGQMLVVNAGVISTTKETLQKREEADL